MFYIALSLILILYSIASIFTGQIRGRGGLLGTVYYRDSEPTRFWTTVIGQLGGGIVILVISFMDK